MAVEIQDHCNCCDLPCINCGRSCVPVAVCDWCGSEEEKFYERGCDALCFDCFRDAEMREVKKIPLNSIYKERLVSCCEWCECDEVDELLIFEGDDVAICEECFEEMLKESDTVSAERIIENYD